MRLKSLQIQGFKSFPDKVELSFDTGMTAVVGPNGSGKSNISDAVRWVLGEQSSKNLRGNKMEDVIFSGTKFRKSSAFASVTLTIDNSDRGLNVENDVVSVNRKLYRSGESEYRINGKSVRLKDVGELFMDTGLGKDGYSIIGQGRIAEIVSSKGYERREIFEEASGISKFRYKKFEAEKKLSLAEDNMLRLNDIVSELETRIKPLKIQSEKAKQFVELSEKRKNIEVSVWLFRLKELQSNLNNLNEKIDIAKSQYNSLESQIESSEQKIQQGYSKMQESSVKVDTFQREITQSQQKLSERKSKIAVFNNDIQHISDKILELKQSKEDNINSKQTLKSKIAELKEKIVKVEKSLNEVNNQLRDWNKNLVEVDNQFSEISNEILEISSKINLVKHDIQKENLTLISIKTIIEETTSQLDSMEINNTEIRTLCEDYKKEIIEVTSKLNDYHLKEVELNNQLNGFQKLLSSKEDKLKSVREKYEEIILDVKEKQQRVKLLTDLENSMEGFSKSVKSVMRAFKNGELKGIFGTVSQLFGTNPEYITAIETALGGAMQNIIVEDENVAKTCIKYLKSGNMGRATFLPVTSVKPQDFNSKDIQNEFGYIGIASDLISCDTKFNNIKSSLLGKIVIVDNLECATLIANKFEYKFKIVTLDGQVINTGGSYTGGSAIHSGGVFSRKSEIDTLNKELNNLLQNEETLKEGKTLLQDEIENIHNDIDVITQQILDNKSISMEYQADLKRLKDIISQYENRLDSTDTQKNTLLNKIKTSVDKKIKSEETIKKLESELNILEQDYNSKNATKDLLVKDRTSFLDKISQLKVAQVEKSKDFETLKNTLNDTEYTLSNLDDKNNSIDLEISVKENIIQEKNQYILDSKYLEKELLINIENLKGEIKSWQEVHLKQEEQVTQVRISLKELNNTRENLSIELIRLDEKKNTTQRDYDSIISQLYDIYEMTFSEANSFANPIEDIQTAQRELAEIKIQIKYLGNVNVSAIDEYKEVLDRYTFLNNQLSDTKKSKMELEKLIENLTKDMKSLFEENFYKINENFKQIFVELFGGGSAELILTDKNDILNSGIEILVSPPSKIIKNLISLSGGEQAFVSIAIYFAILKVKPSPFCILDEIDAPLDEVNVRKYAVYLERFIEKTQFIVVTHRRGTMETANVLYGVTMQKDGVSKLLKLEQKDIPTENF